MGDGGEVQFVHELGARSAAWRKPVMRTQPIGMFFQKDEVCISSRENQRRLLVVLAYIEERVAQRVGLVTAVGDRIDATEIAGSDTGCIALGAQSKDARRQLAQIARNADARVVHVHYEHGRALMHQFASDRAHATKRPGRRALTDCFPQSTSRGSTKKTMFFAVRR